MVRTTSGKRSFLADEPGRVRKETQSRERVRVGDRWEPSDVQQQSRFRDQVGAVLACVTLGAIVLTLLLVLVKGWVQSPEPLSALTKDLADPDRAQAALASYKAILELHAEQVRSEAELYVTLLAPLFTLAVGYLFGQRASV